MKFHQINYLTFPYKIGIKVKLNEAGRVTWPNVRMYHTIGTIVGYHTGAFSPKIYISILWIDKNIGQYFYPEELEIIK